MRGWLGVVIQKITPALQDKLKLEVETGVLISDVVKGGPADKAGILRGDVILSFDGKQIKNTHDLPYLVASTPVGKTVMVELIRQGQGKKLPVTIGELAEERKASFLSEEAPDLGLSVDEITPEIARHFGLSDTKGIVVTTVEEGTPAAEASLMPGDVILEIDNVKVSDVDQFNRKIVTYKAGDTILFLIKRQGLTHFVTVNVGT
ncbi:MAG: PDZ domain-containing protein [Deltaproteobacteria bacterium]|nr:PDZ domain-containing protein [Deltaproteobacteria bacterium]